MQKVLSAIAGFAALIATPAIAADMAVKAPPSPLAPVNSWTGWYIGGNAGYGWKDPTVSFTPVDPLISFITCGSGSCPPPASFQINGALGGLQLGYNWQINQSWVLGFETDFDASRIKGTGGTPTFLISASFPSSFQAGENIKWFGTIRGRVGYLPTSNLLLYGTGGLAYGRIDENVNLSSVGAAGGFGFSYFCSFTVTPNPNCFVGNSSRTAVGFTAGGGAEYRLSQNLSFKAEYLYVDLGHGNAFNVVAQAPFNGVFPLSSFTAAYSRVDFNVVRVGLNYQFH